MKHEMCQDMYTVTSGVFFFQIHSFDEGSVTGSYTGGAETIGGLKSTYLSNKTVIFVV